MIAVDEDGIRHRIKGLIGHNLMEALKLSGFESEGELFEHLVSLKGANLRLTQ